MFSAIVTKKVLNDKKVSPSLMKINYRIVKLLDPIIVVISELAGMSKSGIRRVFIKLNNSYVRTGKYSLKGKDILVLLLTVYSNRTW